MIIHQLNDTINIPIIGEKSLNRTIYTLNRNYNNYAWHDNLPIFNLLEDNQHIISTDVRCHHYLTFEDSEAKSQEYYNYIWYNTTTVTSIAMYQLTCHRLYQKYGNSQRITDIFDKTIERAINLNVHKWIISGRFFKAIYSNNYETIESEFTKIINPSTMMVDMDCYRDKIIFTILWLKLFGSSQSIEPYQKVIDYINGFDEGMRGELLPYTDIDRSILMHPDIFNKFIKFDRGELLGQLTNIIHEVEEKSEEIKFAS
jgi:hypothetical protein